MTYQQDQIVMNFTRIIVISIPESTLLSQRIMNNLPRDIIESPDAASFIPKLDVYWQELHFRL